MTLRRGRRLTRAAIAMIAAVTVLAATLLGGHRYFFCPLMNEASLDACCCGPSDRAAHDSGDAPAIDRESCCVAKRFAAPPATAIAADDPAFRAPLVAVLPPPSAAVACILHTHDVALREARAGPSRAGPREHRLRTMVFLT